MLVVVFLIAAATLVRSISDRLALLADLIRLLPKYCHYSRTPTATRRSNSSRNFDHNSLEEPGGMFS